MVKWKSIQTEQGYVLQALAFFLLGWFIGWVPALTIILLLLTLISIIYLGQEVLTYIPYLLTTILFFETIGRSLALSPWIPWEVGKYLGILLLLYGLFSLSKINRNALLVLSSFILLVPGIIITIFTSDRIYKDLVFNIGGLIFLLLATLFFSNYSITKVRLASVLAFFLFLLLTIVGVLWSNGPNPLNIEYTIIGNNELYLHNNPNQLCTLFSTGWAIFVFLSIFSNRKSIWPFLTNIIFIFWAFLTFSRGGIFVAVGTIISIFCFLFFFQKRQNLRHLQLVFFLVFVHFIACFAVVNYISDGQLLMRYQGETSGTIAGVEEKTLDSYSSGRWQIIQSDLYLLLENPIFGVGVGQSTTYRKSNDYPFPASHTELSRLLSEHGLAGVIIIGILIYLPYLRLVELREHPILQAFVIFCVLLALSHTTHSSFRTSISPILYGFAFIRIADT